MKNLGYRFIVIAVRSGVFEALPICRFNPRRSEGLEAPKVTPLILNIQTKNKSSIFI
jgi:hypothetical protein